MTSGASSAASGWVIIWEEDGYLIQLAKIHSTRACTRARDDAGAAEGLDPSPAFPRAHKADAMTR